MERQDGAYVDPSSSWIFRCWCVGPHGSKKWRLTLRINLVSAAAGGPVSVNWSAFPLPFSSIYTLTSRLPYKLIEATNKTMPGTNTYSPGTKGFQVSSKPSFTEALDPWETKSRFTRTTKGISNTKEGLGAVWNLQSQTRNNPAGFPWLGRWFGVPLAAGPEGPYATFQRH